MISLVVQEDADPAPAPEAPCWWAHDSHANELDPQLKAAHRVAQQHQQQHQLLHEDDEEEQFTEPLVLRNLLSAAQIDEILAEAAVDGVWPRGVGGKNNEQRELSEELQSKAHHHAWTDEHVVLYMHNNDHWFVRTLPVPWSLIRGGMASRPGMEELPILDDAFIGSDESMRCVRTIELHHYTAGGGLLTPGHKDTGSELTMSVLLSDPTEVSGGDFVTYSSSHDSDGREEVVPIAHKMQRGDAILFNSEQFHNISTVKSGVRMSLVVELWPQTGYY
jgi:hypothetical protein